MLWKIKQHSTNGLTDRQILEVSRLIASLSPAAFGLSTNSTNNVAAGSSSVLPFPSGVRVCSVDGKYVAYSGNWHCSEGETCFIDGGEVLRILPCLIETTFATYKAENVYKIASVNETEEKKSNKKVFGGLL